MNELPKLPSLRLDGRRALITGASRGIGLASAAALAQAGAEVVLAARTASDVEAGAEAIRAGGGRASGLALDVTDIASVQRCIAGSGPFDILVNSAGLARHSAFLDSTAQSFDAVMAVNLRATFFVSKAVAEGMIGAGRGGSIITVSSQMGHVGGPERAVYCASKHGVEGLTKALALELGRHNIRVNTVCPTFIETELTRKGLSDPAFRRWVLSKIALGRIGRVEDIMGPVVFLASDGAALVTGASLLVDGGWTAE